MGRDDDFTPGNRVLLHSFIHISLSSPLYFLLFSFSFILLQNASRSLSLFPLPSPSHSLFLLYFSFLFFLLSTLSLPLAFRFNIIPFFVIFFGISFVEWKMFTELSLGKTAYSKNKNTHTYTYTLPLITKSFYKILWAFYLFYDFIIIFFFLFIFIFRIQKKIPTKINRNIFTKGFMETNILVQFLFFTKRTKNKSRQIIRLNRHLGKQAKRL